MRLVVEAVRRGDVGPVRRVEAVADRVQHFLEAQNPEKQLRRQPDLFLEAPLELPRAEPDLSGEIGDAHEAAAFERERDGRRDDDRPRHRRGDGSEHGLERRHEISGQAESRDPARQAARQRRIDVGERDDAIRVAALRSAEEHERAMRPQSRPDEPAVPARRDLHRASDLAGEQHAFLRPPPPVHDLDERLAGVNDDLGMAVGRDRLGRDLAGLAFEQPQPLDDGRQRGRRGNCSYFKRLSLAHRW